MLKIEKELFIKKYNKNIPQIVKHQFIADTETPVSALLKIFNKEKYSFLLESVEGGEQRGRFSLLGGYPDLIWRVHKGKAKIEKLDKNIDITELDKTDPINSLKKLLNFSKIKDNNKDVPYPVLVGYLGYPMIKYMENISLKNPDTLNIPESVMIRPKLVAVFDNIKDTINIMTSVYPSKNISASKAFNNAKTIISNVNSKLQKEIKKSNFISKKLKNKIVFKSNYTKKEYYKIVAKAKSYIKNGDIFQVVTSQRFEARYDLDTNTLYRSLRRLNPSPFLVNLNLNNFGLVASSPEILVRLRNKKITIRPIAGTRKRGKNTKEDKKLSKDLLKDQKELAEHLMLLDLGRNDVGRVSKVGSVEVTEKMIIEYYSHVMHIVSNVEGIISGKNNAIDALISGFPAGTVSGAPKIRAMEIIEELENLNRSFYGGAMGYFDSNGDMDTCISLRTGLIKNKKLYIQAGGGIVHDSNPQKEFQETINKAQALIKAAENSYNIS
ncbi:MAG: Anthranilate synthase component 1 [Alphaproteobacteria bacterium MarineAlpha5_Bin8]|nr:MAG: Anthranilate synthase component 1 [Alphaproteobacteria bacterium MarineAlpha5_Bin7]PPR46578.1 MAG: Anthranilate synthase component 1 [Alphaproteobacteria bacterium MarineAlpha5_Bin8]|tara:strand:+ start:3210 stop:4697 length:1488 start_codon:yes stop_codon:yes gene_type:complete